MLVRNAIVAAAYAWNLIFWVFRVKRRFYVEGNWLKMRILP